MIFGEERNVTYTAGGEYGTTMDAIYLLKSGDPKFERFKPLLFLADMPYKQSKEWVDNALEEYKNNIQQEGEPKSWPADRCLKVWQARKAKKNKKE